jgi:hypothetical protein
MKATIEYAACLLLAGWFAYVLVNSEAIVRLASHESGFSQVPQLSGEFP